MEEEKKIEEVKNNSDLKVEKDNDKIVISKKKLFLIIGLVLMIIFIFLISCAIFLSYTLKSIKEKSRIKSYENRRTIEMRMNNFDNYDQKRFR